MRNAPIPRNSFFDLINSAPGVASTSSDGWNRQTSFGSGTNENSYQLDGTDFTAPISGASWPYPNTDAIEEIEVLSLGATAEYGNVQGAVFNIVTRQGSNTFKGDATVYYQSDDLSGRNTSEEQDGGVPYHRDQYREFTGQVSGPIVKDKLWFFASYQHQKDAFSAVGVPVAFPSRAKQDRIFGKINWQLNPQHKLQFALHNDYYELPSTGDAATAPSAVGLNSGDNPSPNVTYTAVISDKTYVEARYAGFYGNDHGSPLDGSPRINPRFLDLDTGVVTGGVYSWYDGKSNKTGANVKLSHFADNFLGGSHDFKFGVQYASGGGDYTTGYNDYIYTYGGVPAYGYTQLPFKENGQMRTIGTFVDDTFRVNKAADPQPGRALRPQRGRPAGRNRARPRGQPGRLRHPGHRLAVHLELGLAAPRLLLEDHGRRQERAEGPLREVLPRDHHGRVRRRVADHLRALPLLGPLRRAGRARGPGARLGQHQPGGRSRLQEPHHRPVHRAASSASSRRTWACS